jgi:hypothetical protein
MIFISSQIYNMIGNVNVHIILYSGNTGSVPSLPSRNAGVTMATPHGSPRNEYMEMGKTAGKVSMSNDLRFLG